jgi:hypothetical protein
MEWNHVELIKKSENLKGFFSMENVKGCGTEIQNCKFILQL